MLTSKGNNPETNSTKMITLTPAEKLIAAQAYLDDMSYVVNETAEQSAERVKFFGEGYDKNSVLTRLLEKMLAVLK